jgi:hypothetical protein
LNKLLRWIPTPESSPITLIDRTVGSKAFPLGLSSWFLGRTFGLLHLFVPERLDGTFASSRNNERSKLAISPDQMVGAIAFHAKAKNERATSNRLHLSKMPADFILNSNN